MRPCKIIFLQSGRSDKPLTDPVIKFMKLDPLFEVDTMNVIPNSFRGAYAVAKNDLLLKKPDVFYIAGDRIEAAGAMAGAFYNSVKPMIVHYEAGVTNGKVATFDDINRHVISLCSDMQLCEDGYSYTTLKMFFTSLCLEMNAYIVGITRHDDMSMSFKKVPSELFDLILYNPPTMYNEDICSLIELDENKRTIWMEGNGDPSQLNYFQELKKKYPHIEFWENLPRPEFLGLLMKCDTYFTNSSNIYYEAPLFKKPEAIKQIGDRNLMRSTSIERKSGASMKIIEILREWWEDKQNGI